MSQAARRLGCIAGFAVAAALASGCASRTTVFEVTPEPRSDLVELRERQPPRPWAPVYRLRIEVLDAPELTRRSRQYASRSEVYRSPAIWLYSHLMWPPSQPLWDLHDCDVAARFTVKQRNRNPGVSSETLGDLIAPLRSLPRVVLGLPGGSNGGTVSLYPDAHQVIARVSLDGLKQAREGKPNRRWGGMASLELRAQGSDALLVVERRAGELSVRDTSGP